MPIDITMPGASNGDHKKLLLEKAHEISDKLTEVSSLFNVSREELFPTFDFSEFELGRVLGRGGFCTVNEISVINLKNTSANENEARHLMQSRCIRNGDARYAIKKLSDEVVNGSDPDLFVKGVIDLAVEVKYLAVIEHPHIIKMRAMAGCSPYDTNYFVVLDRLYDTLGKRLKDWQTKRQKLGGVLGKMRDMKGKKKDQLVCDKLTVAYDIASALNYLHDHNIIYRDLKPDNIGFDVRGDVKVFDFGLCKELRESQRYDDGTYKLTGYTGSLRFMAPEVALCKPYNLSADVFSYGILFWMIISGAPPYKGYSVSMYENLVVKKGYRPKVNSSWPKGWQSVMADSWSHDSKLRPSFHDIMETLRNEICEVGEDEDGTMLDISRKTNNSISNGFK
mmetsp:Transcript_18624/g.23117  ORF Transcript_18624/g.23117 Transcript_18624/m.23117 type:complete len:394 (-) Transcript_18624:143-1324(-)